VINLGILVYADYTSGSGGEIGPDIAAEGLGRAYATGHTYSTEKTFCVATGTDLTVNKGTDAFVAKIRNPFEPSKQG
jgi:hypothetical protein